MVNTLLYQSAMKYKTFLNIGYHVILGRKQKTYILDLRFPSSAFFHLSGIQHLHDLTFSSANKERIYKDILTGKTTQEFLEKSKYFINANITVRMELLIQLEDMLDQLPQYYKINFHEYQKYTTITADFLSILQNPEPKFSQVYYFLVHHPKEKLPSCYIGCSLFRKTDKDYTKGTSKTTLLLLEKTTHINENNYIELYRNPNYKDKLSRTYLN